MRILPTEDFLVGNVEEVLRYTHKLEETNERLREENDLLDAEMKLREAQLQIDEQNRLYDQLTCDMKEQLDLLEGLLKSDRVTGRQRIAKICVLSAYMKRRSNLCFWRKVKSRLRPRSWSFVFQNRWKACGCAICSVLLKAIAAGKQLQGN